MGTGFFDEPLDQSGIKASIVADYFPAWGRIILKKAAKIGFVDLYSGPGRYSDSTESTPLLLLKNVIEEPKLAEAVVCVFNDKEADEIRTLENEIRELTEVSKLNYFPKFLNFPVSDDILHYLQDVKDVPTFYFLDPWGYKGLSLELIKYALQAWGSECLFFFNYNRINPALQNENVTVAMNALFGIAKAESLRNRLSELKPYQREVEIIRELCGAMIQMGGKYVLPFCFKHAEQDKTSHYLIFVGKHPLGYGLMKEIMAKYSDVDDDKVPTFTFDPKRQMELNFNSSLSELAEDIVSSFVGRQVTVKEIYGKHQQSTRFIKRNYKDALILLETRGRISVDKPAHSRPFRGGKPTLGDNRIITIHRET